MEGGYVGEMVCEEGEGAMWRGGGRGGWSSGIHSHYEMLINVDRPLSFIIACDLCSGLEDAFAFRGTRELSPLPAHFTFVNTPCNEL